MFICCFAICVLFEPNNLKWEPFSLPILRIALILSILHASCEIHLNFETWRNVRKMFYVIRACNIANQMNTSYDLGANPSLGGIARNITLLVF
jgi:disulfide bond formation protein DsbB